MTINQCDLLIDAVTVKAFRSHKNYYEVKNDGCTVHILRNL